VAVTDREFHPRQASRSVHGEVSRDELMLSTHWTHHVAALALYSGTVLIAAPIVLGRTLNYLMIRAERGDGPPNRWMAALGAGVSRDAFDLVFQRVSRVGAWVVVELVGHSEQEPRLLGGVFGGPRYAFNMKASSYRRFGQGVLMGLKSPTKPPAKSKLGPLMGSVVHQSRRELVAPSKPTEIKPD
jgi:hypothetical protein